MRSVLVDDMRRPRHLGRPDIYRYPLPKTPVALPATDTIVPRYESTPVTITIEPAFLIVCKANADIASGSVRLLLSRKNTEFINDKLSPAFVYENGYDSAEVTPIRVSELGGGNVFVFATTAWVETFRIRLFYPVDSFAVYLLTPEEAAAYRIGAIDIFPPFRESDIIDPVLADDFEKEP